MRSPRSSAPIRRRCSLQRLRPEGGQEADRGAEAPAHGSARAPPPEPTLGRFEDVAAARPGGAKAAGRPDPEGKPHPALRRRAKAALSRQAWCVRLTRPNRCRRASRSAPAQIPLVEEKPLGDLTPDWTTEPGAGGAGAARRRARPGAGTRRGSAQHRHARRHAHARRPRDSAVPGRPDLPDTLVSGAPARVPLPSRPMPPWSPWRHRGAPAARHGRR